MIALAVLPCFDVKYLRGYFSEPTLWDLTTREPVILTVVAVAAIVSALGAALADRAILLVIAAAASFYLFGRIFPPGLRAYNVQGTGLWVATGAAAGMSLGGVLAAVGAGFASGFARRS